VTLGDISCEAEAGSMKHKAAQKIELICGGSSITMTPDKISIKSMAIEVKADMNTKIKSGMNSKIESGMCTTIKSGMKTEVSAGILTSVKGGFVKIN